MDETRVDLKGKLPSRHLVYDVDPAAISIRVLKGKDEKLIAEMTYENSARKLLSVLKNVLAGIDPEKLTLGDEKYIMLWLTINSYTPVTPLEFVCEGCMQKIQRDINLSELEVKELPEGFKEPYPVKLSEGTVVNLRLLRTGDEIKILDYEKKDSSAWLYRYALSIVDDKVNIVDKVQMLENMNACDLALIRAFHEKYDHGPIMESKYECPKCGFEGVVTVPFRLELFFPFGNTLKATFGNRV